MGAEARSVHSRRRNAKPQAQNGPETVLYTFQGGSDGGNPNGNLIFDSSGNLYGVTEFGGGGSCSTNGGTGCGTVFELSPNGSGGWTETILYSFQGGNDGEGPSSGLIFDQAGNLYGTTTGGGGNVNCAIGCGTVFELSPNGSGGWTETLLYIFGTNGGASDGEQPEGLIFDKSGNLYGPTGSGGNTLCDHDQDQSCGTVFELAPNGSGGWTETIIYSFPSGGAFEPNPGLIFDQSGNLYGTTSQGGAGGCMGSGGCGTVFELSPNGGGTWTATLLYQFVEDSGGQIPLAGVIFDQSGNLYGTAAVGGAAGVGTVFELSPNGSGGWTEAALYSFQDGSDGAFPDAGLIFDQSRNLYSTTGDGGGSTNCPGGCGTAFELSPNGSGSWTETILYSFQGGKDGSAPNGMIFDQSGHLYGTTSIGGGTGCVNSYGCGVAFEITREPFAKISPASLAFGNETVGITSSPQVVTLTNIGNLPFSITSIQIGGANSSNFAQTNNCPSSLGANSSCTINVTFTPTALGSDSASLIVTDTAPGGTQTVALTGTGAAYMVTISPSSVTFPGQYVGTSGLNQNVQLTNNGPGPLTISSVVASPASDFSQLSACGNSLAAGASCSIGVFFDPSTSGTRNGTLTIRDNAPGSPQVVPLTGTGEDFSMSPTVPNQTVPPGRTAIYSLTMMPEGGFKQTVQLSCSGAPTMSTCSVSPAAATLNGSTAQTVTVTVTTAGASAGLVVPGSVPPSVSAHSLWLPLSGALGLVGFVLPMRKRRFRRRGAPFGLTLLCLLAVSMMPGCGGGTSSSGGSGTPAGTYNLTVTGSFTSGSSTLTHAAKLNLVVQ
jgi:uncharacterized repeat protein (TIGR03803 family)